jgi:Na+-transporting methylmalonyl-CoA/oxaloacetate decarboxylase gamma subunit
MIILKLNPDAVDSNAIIITIVGYFIVFAALIILYSVFFYIPKLMNLKIRLKHKQKNQDVEVQKPTEEITGDVIAAISIALHLHFNQYHDEENTSMTIKRESRLYSPWSSKIYQVRNQFNRL